MSSLTCPYCEKMFALKSNLDRHIRLHMEVVKSFVCEHCGAEYFTNSALKEHCISAHKEIKPFECGVCKKRFSHQRSLRKHALSHSDERPFQCTLCPQVSDFDICFYVCATKPCLLRCHRLLNTTPTWYDINRRFMRKSPNKKS